MVGGIAKSVANRRVMLDGAKQYEKKNGAVLVQAQLSPHEC
jgi:hypothetical protein